MNRPLNLVTGSLVAIAASLTVPSVDAQPLDYALIADTNTPIPGGTGNFTQLPLPAISNGVAVFNGAGSDDQEGIYVFRDAQLDVLVNQDTPVPNGTGRFTSFNSPTLDPDFNIAFRAEGDSGQIGIYTHMDGTLAALADLATDVPGTGGAEQFTDFSVPWIYNGEVAFRGLGSGGTDGIYTNQGGSLRVVADTSTSIPGGTGAFTDFGSISLTTGRPLSAPDIEDDIVFRGSGSSGQKGIYAEVDGELILIANNQTINPSTGFPFPGFDSNGSLAANIHNGEVVFVGGNTTQLGLFKYSQGTISTIVDRNTVNPDTGGTLHIFGGAQGYGFDDGNVSFLGADISSPFNIVFAVLDGQLVTVATPAKLINGEAPVVGSVGTYGGGLDDGSVAFYTGLADFVAIQEHRWLGTGSAVYDGTGDGDLWDDPANWPFGLLPRNVVPTVIDPAGDVTVHGPHADVALTGLQVGGGTGIATLWLIGGTTISVPTAIMTPTGLLAGNGEINGNLLNNGLVRPDNVVARDIQNNAAIEFPTYDARLTADDVTNDGTITGEGTLFATFLTNNGLVDVRQIILAGACIENSGEIRLSYSNALVKGADEIQNDGLIRGSGKIDAGVFDNNSSGEIRVGSGERLEVQVDISNGGLVEVLAGELDARGGIFNGASGLIAARDATLRFGTGLNNNAALAISFGTSDVFGDVDNNASGTIVLTGNSSTTFFDDVANDGAIQVSSGSTVVFLGDFTGANGTTGTGTVFMEGDLRPGNSPAAVSFGGNLHFGALASLEIELGGTVAGSEYDALDVAGALTLGGRLEVALVNAEGGLFQPSLGDAFEVIAAGGGVDGTFDDHLLPELDGNLAWRVNYGANSVDLVVFLPGDYNGNGAVDAADYTVWRNSLGQFGVGLAADGDGNNRVDTDDYAFWKARYGNSAGSSVAGAASQSVVPEPCALALLSLGLFGGPLFRRANPLRRA